MKHKKGVGWEYAKGVVSGKILACKYIKLQCSRSLALLKKKKSDWEFVDGYVQHFVQFSKNVPHIKGTIAGTMFELADWQLFFIGQIYGWRSKKDHDIKKYTKGLLEVPRKNGKSFLCSVIAMYELLYGDNGGEIYSIATKSDQAKLVWSMAVAQIKGMPKHYKEHYRCITSTIHCDTHNSFYKYLAKDSKTQDGFNPSLVIADEAGAIDNPHVFDVMESGFGARKSPLILYITTAQNIQTTRYFETRQHLKSVLLGDAVDERLFGLLYNLDIGDDYRDESVWGKCNPNLGISVYRDFLESQVKGSQDIPSKANEVKTKQFNIYTASTTSWLPLEVYRRGLVEKIEKKGELFVGWDLSATRDLTAICFLWKYDDYYEVEYKCFAPSSMYKVLPSSFKSRYRDAIETGSLTIIDGDVIDYRIVGDVIKDYDDKYGITSCGSDQYNAHDLKNILDEEGIECQSLSQSITQFSPVTKEVEISLYNGIIKYEQEAFVDWQLENCTLYTDVNNNIKVRKGKDVNKKIDAIVALLCAVSVSGNINTDECSVASTGGSNEDI